ncbi:hypothetical protein BJ875DRAFT_462525 [Amylocarpus encephaloides]|uniref:DUF676 domain-containing protein n=1 Tax=Amylocarpus encephaloides TaxID=45428 RepID=A0A9P7YHT8_9HELO|nr:hypothetical protein BJ875DRAFT_462525 [Amylocarpus encephaloides]
MSPPSIGRLQELRPAMAGNNKRSSNDTIIFVHGLDTASFKSLRRSWKSWLRHLTVPDITAAAIYTFSFNLVELILNGREKLLQVSEAFNLYIERLKRRTPDRRFVFLGHGIASFVIQATLARHQSFLIAQSTIAVLFIGLPKLAEDIDWDKYKFNFLQRLSKGSKQHGERSLDFSDIQWTRTNFDLLTNSGASFQVESFDVPEGHEEMPRRRSFRESNSRQGTGSSSASSNDGKELNSQHLSLPNIQQNDDLHKMCVEGLRKAFTLDQTTDKLPPPPEPVQTVQDIPPQAPPSQSTNVPHDCLERSMARDLRRRSSNLESRTVSRSMSRSPKPESRLNHESRARAVAQSLAQRKIVEVVDPKEQQHQILNSNRRQELQKLSQLAGDYHYRGNFHQAAQIYQDLLLEIEAGNDHSWTITAQCNLAVAWLQQGKIWKAVNKLEELNRIGDEKLPKSHRTTWDIKRWLGIGYDRQGHYQKAYDMLEEQIKRINECMAQTQTSDPSFVEAADILKESGKNAMSLVVCHDGRHTEALLMNKKVLSEAKNRSDEAKDGPGPWKRSLKLRLARIQVNGSLINVFSGNYEESLALLNASSKVMEKELGSRHVATLECWWLRAWLLAVRGSIDEAEIQCNKTVDGMTTSLGKDHPSTLKALAVRVFIYRMQGRFTTAKTTAKSLVQSNSIVLGLIHPQTMHSQDALTSVYIARGELKMALKTQLDLIDLSSSSLREDHPMALAYMCNLATVYGRLEDWDTAERILLGLLSKQRRLLRIKDVDQAPSSEPIARDGQRPVESMQKALDLVYEAVNLIKSMLSGSTKEDLLLPLPAPTLYATIHCLGTVACRNGRGDLSLAARFLTISTKLRSDFFGNEHFDTLASKLELAVCERHSSNLAASKCALVEIVETRTKMLGENHLDTVYARHELALTKAHIGDVIQAMNEMRVTLSIRSMLLGAEHPDTIKSQNDLFVISEYFYLQTLYDWIVNFKYQPIEGEDQSLSKDVAELKSMVMGAFSASAQAKPNPEMLGHDAYSEQEDLNARLTPQITANIEALVALYVAYKHFTEAIEMQLLLLAHQESDLGLDDSVTLHSTDVLAFIYHEQGTQYLNNLKQLSRTKDTTTLNSLLSEYYDSQVSLAILYSDAGDYETSFAIQTGTMNILKRYELGADPKIMIRGMIDLAWARKELKETTEAIVLLRDADKMNRDLEPNERLDFDLDQALAELGIDTY